MGSIGRNVAAAALLAAAAAPAFPPAALADEGTWPSIREALFAGRELKDGRGVIALEAPDRAHDAAVVPVTIRTLDPRTPGLHIRTVHLVIDQNPAPVAAVFRLAPEAGAGGARISTRVRVNEYTPVHAVAETADGSLYVVDRFVKAAGGCSAPAGKDNEAAMARLGQMRVKTQGTFAAGEPVQAQVLISHPNYSGLQIDQLTRNWIPPDYVRNVKVSYDGRPVLEVEGDISLSEDPSISFSFNPAQPGGAMDVAVEDSQGRKFAKSFPVGPAS